MAPCLGAIIDLRFPDPSLITSKPATAFSPSSGFGGLDGSLQVGPIDRQRAWWVVDGKVCGVKSDWAG